jgi:hypothetical protein
MISEKLKTTGAFTKSTGIVIRTKNNLNNLVGQYLLTYLQYMLAQLIVLETKRQDFN